MPWAVVGAVAGAGISASASNSASKKQQGAADAATQLQQNQYNETVDRNKPFLGAGTDALALLQQKLPDLNSTYDPSKLTSEPGYQFGMQQGQQALERSMAARGRGVSGAALKAASEFGTNYSTTKLNDAFSRDQSAKQQSFNQLQALTNIGQASANNSSAAGQNFANSAAANTIGAGDSAAANSIAQGNIWGGLVNQGVSAYGRSGSGGGSSGGFSAYDANGAGMPSSYDASTGGSYHAADNYGDAYMADGGPVRTEPRIGSRSPLPGGTGGGMSRDAILAALTSAQMQAQPQRTGMAALPANPVTDPGAILAAQGQQAGAYANGGQVKGPIRGPGTATSDSIAVPMQGGGKAHLSNGEHVFDADSVTALGDGDNEKGQALLNEMRTRIKAHKAKH